MSDPDQAQRATGLRALLPASPQEHAQTLVETARVIRQLSQLDYRRRQPPALPAFTASQLRQATVGLVGRSLAQQQVNPVVRSSAELAVGQLPEVIFQGAAHHLRQNSQQVQMLLWHQAQSQHSAEISYALVASMCQGLVQEVTTRASAIRQERGDVWVGAHLLVAGASPFTPLVQSVFGAGAVYSMLRDLLSLAGTVLRYQARPQELALDLLRALHFLLDLAFASRADALRQVDELGRTLAAGFAASAQAALFPDPLGEEGEFIYGATGQRVIRAADEAGLTFVRNAASLVMVPWTMGTFIGPLLLDVALTVVGFLVPGGQLVAALRAIPQLRRVWAVVDAVLDGASFGVRMRRFVEVPDGDALGPAARMAGPDHRGVPDVPVQAAAPDAPSASAHAPGATEAPQAPEAPGSGGGVHTSAIELPDELPPDPRGVPHHDGLLRVWRQLAERHGIDVTHPPTLEKLNDLYRRMGGQYTHSTRVASTVDARAAAGELRALLRYGRQGERGGSTVVRLRFVPETSSARTPDVQVIRQRGDEFLEFEYVEIRTVSQARRGSTVTRARGTRDRATYRPSIEAKLYRGQLSASRPGTLIFHSPFQQAGGDFLDFWQNMLNAVRTRRGAAFPPPGLRRIEVTTGHGGLIVFEPPNWQGQLVRTTSATPQP